MEKSMKTGHFTTILSIALAAAFFMGLPQVFPQWTGVFAQEQRTHYDAQEDMSGVQGENGWYYKYAPVGAFTLGSYEEYSYYNSSSQYWMYADPGTAPDAMKYGRVRSNQADNDQITGNLGDACRVFRAPASGTLELSMKDGMIQEISAGDVSRFRILKNETVVYPADGGWLTLAAGESEEFQTLTLSVEKGDQIIFRANKGSNSASNSQPDEEGKTASNDGDKLAFIPVIDYTAFAPDPTPDPEQTGCDAELPYLTDSDGNLANSAEPGTIVRPNVCLVNKSTEPSAEPIIGTLLFTVYSQDHKLLHANAAAVNQNTARELYTGAAYSLEENSYVKVMLWDGLGSMKPLLKKNLTYPQFARAQAITAKAPAENLEAVKAAYPAPEEHWTAKALDTGTVYRYAGGAWNAVENPDTLALYESEQNNGVITPPAEFPEIPFTITRTGKRTYTHDATPENQRDWSAATEIFLTTAKADGGADANDLGTDAAAPITAGRWQANYRAGSYVKPGTAEIQQEYIFTLVDDYYNWSSGAHSLNFAYSATEIPIDALIRSGAPSGFTWMGALRRQGNPNEITQDWIGEDGVYKTVQKTNEKIYALVNFQDLDRYGMPRPRYTKVSSLEECQAAEGTFYQLQDGEADTATIYCNPVAGETLSDLSLVMNKSLLSNNIYGGRTLMYQNLGILPGVFIQNTVNGHLVEQAQPTFYFFGCKFWRSVYNAIGLGMDYHAFLLDCTAAYASVDGFNYHASKNSATSAVEVNCVSYGSGTKLYEPDGASPSTSSNNGSTAHDSMKIFRVGGRYWNCMGSVVADVKDCLSISLGCEVYSIMAGATGQKYAFWLDNRETAAPANQKYIVDCFATGTNMTSGLAVTANSYVCDYEGFSVITDGDHLDRPVTPNEISWAQIKSGAWK